MYYQFDTDSIEYAKAALLLYAMYKSRDNNSPLNGLDTWDRFQTFMRAATLKSRTTAEFVQEFCKKAKISSVIPKYLTADGLVVINAAGELRATGDGINEYALRTISDDSLLALFERESIFLIMLVRERIQREKLSLEEQF